MHPRTHRAQTLLKMIVRTHVVPRGFDAITVWPFILVRPGSADDAPLMAHERVHYIEQRSSGVLPWLICYAASKRFRLAAEVRGYKAQVAAGGTSVAVAARLLTSYRTGVTEVEAHKLLTSA